MEQSDLLRNVVDVLERMGIRYFITGSMATIFYGEPRFTNDIDLVAEIPSNAIKRFCAEFPVPDYYLSEEAVQQAIVTRSQFNIIHPASGLKVDVILPTQSAFDRSRFSRIVRVHPEPDYEAAFASIEDVILKKMEYYQLGGAEKHLRDIAGVLKISGEAVDRKYILEWAQRLGLGDIWQSILTKP